MYSHLLAWFLQASSDERWKQRLQQQAAEQEAERQRDVQRAAEAMQEACNAKWQHEANEKEIKFVDEQREAIKLAIQNTQVCVSMSWFIGVRVSAHGCEHA